MFATKEIMTHEVVSIDPDDRVEHAINLMLDHGLNGLPVVDSADQLLGVITAFDVMDMVSDIRTEKNKVYHYMTRDLETVEANASIFELSEKFRGHSIRCYPVVEKGRLVGIVGRRDLIRFVRDLRSKAQEDHLVAEESRKGKRGKVDQESLIHTGGHHFPQRQPNTSQHNSERGKRQRGSHTRTSEHA